MFMSFSLVQNAFYFFYLLYLSNSRLIPLYFSENPCNCSIKERERDGFWEGGGGVQCRHFGFETALGRIGLQPFPIVRVLLNILLF